MARSRATRAATTSTRPTPARRADSRWGRPRRRRAGTARGRASWRRSASSSRPSRRRRPGRSTTAACSTSTVPTGSASSWPTRSRSSRRGSKRERARSRIGPCDPSTQGGDAVRPTTGMMLVIALATGAAPAARGAEVGACATARVSRDALAESFHCNMDLRLATRPPVLLVPGTALEPDENFGWNYVPALDAKGWPVCTVEPPDHTLADIQLSAQHVAFAIREAFRLSGFKVQVIGFSQGGMIPRWTLRFFPDTRQKVEELISLSGSHHGAIGADLFCGPFATPDPSGVVGCEAAIWQQGTASAFIGALNDGFETVPGVDYTAIYTIFDDVLFENASPAPTSALAEEGANVVNVTLQELCPANTANHRAIGTYDPVGWAIALDALAHPGPADPARVLDGNAPGASPICAETVMPGVDPSNFAAGLALYDGAVASALGGGAHLTEEPPLACSTRGSRPRR